MPEPTIPVPTPPPSAFFGRPIIRWLLIAVGQIAFVVAAVSVTLFLANRRPQSDPGNNRSLEEQWNEAISRLGIEPIYPPQEDFAVGDVFVTVVADAAAKLFYGGDLGPNPGTQIFAAKTVKLGHASVSKMLDDAYQEIPLFPSALLTTTAAAPSPNGAVAVSIFGAHPERTDLPGVAFPGFTIADNGSAATGAAGSSGWFNFGASRAASQKLVLGAAETYGLDPVTGKKALDDFCHASGTSELCTETGSRKYLHFIVPRALDKHFDKYTQTFQYDLTIRIFMIYRVYLAHEILEQWSSLVSEGGGVRAAISTQGEVSTPSNEAKTSDQPKGGGETVNPLEERMQTVERQLSNTSRGSAIVYRSSAGTDILLDQKFPRALAVGYRSVDYEISAAAGDVP